LRFAQHVAEQPLFRDENEHRDDERAQVDGGNVVQIGEPRAGTPQHAEADRNQQRAEKQRRDCFIAAVSVIVICVRLCTAMPIGKQHDKIGNQVGERMDTVGDQCLRVREHADGDLQRHQHRIQRNTHKRAFARDTVFFGGFDGGGRHGRKK